MFSFLAQRTELIQSGGYNFIFQIASGFYEWRNCTFSEQR